jgi:hypothetical protein
MERNIERSTQGVASSVAIDSLMRNASKAKSRSPMVARRVATLERETPHFVDLGRSVNVNIDYLGIAPMFDGALMFAGDNTDWIVGPVSDDEIPVVPREQRMSLERLEAAGAHFPLLYVAHEVAKGNFPDDAHATPGTVAPIPSEHLAELVGPSPQPAVSVELADSLSVRANQVFRAMGRVGTMAGVVAAAPFVLVGSAIAAIGTLDPMLLGVIPAVLARPGEPAAWYVLARWDW